MLFLVFFPFAQICGNGARNRKLDPPTLRAKPTRWHSGSASGARIEHRPRRQDTSDRLGRTYDRSLAPIDGMVQQLAREGDTLREVVCV